MEEIYRTETNQLVPCGAEVLGTSLYHSEVSRVVLLEVVADSRGV